MKRKGERILVAGIGNVFMGDDAFGVEVVRCVLGGYEVPMEVRVEDFGIRGYDLVYALGDGYEGVVLIDAVSRDDPPGTLSMMRLETDGVGGGGVPQVDGHALDPIAVLALAKALLPGERLENMVLIGCQPQILFCPDGGFGVSAVVSEAVPRAVAMLRRYLVSEYSIHLNRREIADMAKAINY